MLDEPLDAAIDLGLGRLGGLGVGEGVDGAAGDVVDQLLDDEDRLLHLFEADQEAAQHVAGGGDGDLEVHGAGALAVPVVFEAEVGLVLADVALHAAGPGDGAAEAPVDGFFFGDHADAFDPVAEDAVFQAQPFEVGQRRGQLLADDRLDHGLEDLFVGQVLHRPAHARPVGVEALAGDVVDHVHDGFTLVEAVEEAGEGPQVERRGAHAQQVVLDAAQLAHDRPQHGAARGDGDVEQLLDGVVPRDVVADGADVVHPADDGDVLVVVQRLAELFKAAVQVADVRGHADHPLAVELHHHPQGGVGGGVLGAEVQGPAVAAVPLLAAGPPAGVVEVLGGLDVEVDGFEVVGHGGGCGRGDAGRIGCAETIVGATGPARTAWWAPFMLPRCPTPRLLPPPTTC